MEPWASGKNPERDIAVLMSGGVDSSVTALLLKQGGWNVLGITMKLPVAQRCDVQRSCCGTEAAYVCRDLGIAHYYLDVRDAFREIVIEPFRRAYAEGRTPSPCVDCNTLFKFGIVWDFIEKEFGIGHVATGHYARVLHTDCGARLARGMDKARDQSYFLYGIPRHRLENFMPPLGEMSKDEVRALAKEEAAGRQKTGQHGTVFCRRRRLSQRARWRGCIEGTDLDAAGNVIGEHGNCELHHRPEEGLGIAAGKPLYVIRIDSEENSVTVGTQDEAVNRVVRAEEVNVLIPDELYQKAHPHGKIRSQGEPDRMHDPGN